MNILKFIIVITFFIKEISMNPAILKAFLEEVLLHVCWFFQWRNTMMRVGSNNDVFTRRTCFNYSPHTTEMLLYPKIWKWQIINKSNTTDSKKYFKTKTHSKSQSNEHDQMMLKILSFIHRRFTAFNLKQRISTGLTVWFLF